MDSNGERRHTTQAITPAHGLRPGGGGDIPSSEMDICLRAPCKPPPNMRPEASSCRRARFCSACATAAYLVLASLASTPALVTTKLHSMTTAILMNIHPVY